MTPSEEGGFLCLSTTGAHKVHPTPIPHAHGHAWQVPAAQAIRHMKGEPHSAALTLILSGAHGRCGYSFSGRWAKAVTGHLLQLWSNTIRRSPDTTGSFQSKVRGHTETFFSLSPAWGAESRPWKVVGIKLSSVRPATLHQCGVIETKGWKDLLCPLSVLWGPMSTGFLYWLPLFLLASGSA